MGWRRGIGVAVLACLVVSACLGRFPAGAWAQEAAASQASVQVVESTAAGLTLELTLPAPQIETLTRGGRTCQQVTVAGLEPLDTPGAPALPVWATLIGLPPGSRPVVDVLEVETQVIPLSGDLCPAPTPRTDPPRPEGVLGHEPPSIQAEYVPDAAIYGAGKLYPSSIATLGEPGTWRDQRYTWLQVHAARYNPARQEIELYSAVKLRVSFVGAADGSQAAPARPESQVFERILELSLINDEQARAWRANPGAEPLPADGPLDYLQGPSYRLSVQQAGMYKLTYSYLQGLGLPVDTLDPTTFQLYSGGQQVALLVAGEQDGHFDPQDYLLFYGQELVTKYTKTNVYWLTYGQEAGQRVTTRDGAPGGAPVPSSFLAEHSAQQDLSYIPWAPGGDELDRWLWNYVYPPSIAYRDYHFELSNIATGSASASLQVVMLGALDSAIAPDHHARIYVNGTEVGDTTWDGLRWHTFEQALPQNVLVEGDNVLRVEGPNDTGQGYDFIYFDSFRLGYWDTYRAEGNRLLFAPDRPGALEYRVGGFATPDIQVFSVTDPYAIVSIANSLVEPADGAYRLRFQDAAVGPYAQARYYALTSDQFLLPSSAVLDTPSNLRATTNGADYIIIAHSDLVAPLAPLVQYRGAQGLRTAVVTLQDVFDEFSAGVYDPQAIHGFLAHAYTQWTAPAPTYVLLVGDGHYDYKNNYNRNFPQYLPPYMAPVDLENYETATDMYYVRFDQDPLPDMLIGRLPVNSVDETTVMVNKVLQYETAPSPANTTITFAADNIPDPAGNFEALSEALISSYLSAPYAPDRVYLTALCGPPASPAPVCQAGRTALADSINAGRLFVNWMGHGARYFWAHEQVLTVNTLSALTNAQHLPIMLPMTCNEGQFHMPDLSNRSGMGEAIVRRAGGGAVASWSPTGQGLSSGHYLLEQGLFTAVFSNGVRDLGAATLLAKAHLWSVGSMHQNLIHTYHLFGDPALHINALDADVSVTKSVQAPAIPMPGLALTYTLTFTNAGPATAHGVVLADLLPAGLVAPEVIEQTGNVLGLLPGPGYRWRIADLAPGETGLIRVRATIDPLREPPFYLANQATITMNEPDLNPANDSATANTAVLRRRPTDLRLAKAVQAPAELGAGDLLTYTLTFTNAGPGAAHDVVLTDLLPGLLLDPEVIYTSPEVLGQLPGATLAWAIVDLLPGMGGEIRFVARAGARPLPAYWITNSAELSSLAPETAPGDNTATAAVQVLRPDLRLEKTVEAPGNPMPGQVLTYTLTFTNAGQALARGVVLTDLLPAGLLDPAVVYASPEVIEPLPGAPYRWRIVNLAPEAGGQVRVRATIDPALQPPSAIVNQALIDSATSDCLPANNQAVAVTSIGRLRPADLWITKTVDAPAEPLPGDTLTYTLAFGNAGPGLARRVVITDVVSALLLTPTVVYSSPEVVGQLPGAPFAWSVVDLPAGMAGEIRFTAVAAHLPVPAYDIDNQARIGALSPEVAPADNVAAATVQVLRPDLRLSKTVQAPRHPMPGDTLTYTLAFANHGAVVARDVRLVDWLPAELLNATVVFSSPEVISRHPGSPLTWTLVDLPPGASGEVRVRGVLSPTLVPPLAVVNQAAITSTTPDANPADNLATRSLGLMMPDMWVVQQGPAAVELGDVVTYTITWGNQGSVAMPGPHLTATLPAGTSYVGDDSGWPAAQPAPGVVTWDMTPSPVPTGTTGTLVLTAALPVAPGLAGPLLNQLQIVGQLADGNPADDTSTWSSALLLPDVSVVKTGPAEVDRGSLITYTLSWANDAPARAPGVRITETLPVGVEYVSDNSGWPLTQPSPGVLVWSAGPNPLPAGAAGSFLVTGQVTASPGLSPLLLNRVRIATSTDDTDPANNLARWYTAVLTPNLAINKTGPAATSLGETLTYTLSWANLGPGSAPSVRITDTLPLGAEYLSDSSGLPLTQPETGVLVWTVSPGLLPPGASSFQVVARLAPVRAAWRPLVNVAAIGMPLAEENLADNVSTWTTAILTPSLSVTKTGPARVSRGDVITYTLSWANDGPGSALMTLLTDTLPAGVEYLSDDSGLPIEQPAPGVVVWPLSPSPLPAGASGSFALRARVSLDPGLALPLVNRLYIATPAGEDDLGDNTARWFTSVMSPNLAVNTGGSPAATWGDVVTFTIGWANSGPGSAPGVRITDTLPAGVSYLSDNSGWPPTQPAAGVLVWQVPAQSVPAGASGTFVVTGQVALDPGLGWPLVNHVAAATTAPEVNPTDNQATWPVGLILPDLSVSKVGPAQVTAGAMVTYTLALANDGDGLALGVRLTDALPVGLTYLGDDSGLPHVQPDPGTVAWAVASLAPGEALTFDVWARVDGGLAGSVLTNTVVVAARTPDADWSNHLAWWSTPVLTPTRWFGYYLPLVMTNR